MVEKLRRSKLEGLGDKILSADGSESEKKPVGFHPSGFSDDPGSNNSGYYELKVNNIF